MKSGKEFSRELKVLSQLREKNANCVELLDFFISQTENGVLIQNFIL